MSEMRPLPSKPSLEFERKEAKALLRQLRAGDHQALLRALKRHPALHTAAPAAIQLADAQLVIAREYGFASWPRLVRYFESAERLLRRTPSSMNPGLFRPDDWPRMIQNFMSQHARRIDRAGRSVIAYVPRCYGLSLDEAFDTTLTEDEARLAIARQNGFISWDALMHRVQASHNDPMRQGALELSPRKRASIAIREADLPQLQRVVDEHPELLTPTEYESATGSHLLTMAIDCEREERQKHADGDRFRPIFEWLSSVGFDIQRELNIRLCGHMYMKPEEVQYWIDRGADPNWIAPNGYSVLEHAIIRYWSSVALDRLAAHVREHKPALWIAAGLGDVEGVARFLDSDVQLGLPGNSHT